MRTEISEDIAAIALTSLSAMTPRRLRSLLHSRRPNDILRVLETWTPNSSAPVGPVESLLSMMSSRSPSRSLGSIWKEELDSVLSRVVEYVESSPIRGRMGVSVLGRGTYPTTLMRDPQAPAVLFSLGDLDCLNGPRVGIIGTRHATAHGRDCARRFGEVLSAHGIGIVSGLARGIDISAHRGVFDHLRRSDASCDETRGRPIGVVASGLDIVYPPEHVDMWERVASTGVMLSESPPGTEPQAFRFPLRNRIIAALCHVLVVVESRATGGSMITVRAALERGVTVMAVPGSTSVRSAEGTNALIRDGAAIAVEPEDVLAVLGLEVHRRSPTFDPRPSPIGADGELLEVLGCEPMTIDHVVARSRRELADVALALGRLESQGWVMCTGGWFERIGMPDD